MKSRHERLFAFIFIVRHSARVFAFGREHSRTLEVTQEVR
jgi:hypothetical protein